MIRPVLDTKHRADIACPFFRQHVVDRALTANRFEPVAVTTRQHRRHISAVTSAEHADTFAVNKRILCQRAIKHRESEFRVEGANAFLAVLIPMATLVLVVPIPGGLGPARPYLLAMLLCYWLLEAPDRIGLGVAFLAGLAADLVAGTLFGEQALRLVVLVFLVQRFRARLRFFPLWQQALAVAALLLNDRLVVLAVHLAAGLPQAHWTAWASPLLGFALWPWLFLLLDEMRLRQRDRAG